MQKTNGLSIGIGALVSWVLTIILTLILALVCYKFNITRDTAKFIVLGIYVVSNFVGGFVCGKKGKTKRFIKGAMSAILYVVLLFIISIIVDGGMKKDIVDFLLTVLLCVISGMFGGMLS